MKIAHLLILFPFALSLHAQQRDTTAISRLLDEAEVVAHPKEIGGTFVQPTAVSSLSGTRLESSGVARLTDLTAEVPALSIPDYGSTSSSAIYIRGIGSRINTPAVGLYVDGIPYANRASFVWRFYDIARLNVLRGPQGTLYGAGTMGGLISVESRSPYHYQGTSLHLGYATGDNHRTADVTHYHRPSQQLAFSVGGYYDGGDGFFTNSTTGRAADDGTSAGGRLRGLLRLPHQWLVDASVAFDFTTEGAYPYHYIGTRAREEEFADELGLVTAGHEGTYTRRMVNVGITATHRGSRYTLRSATGYQYLNDHMMMDQDFLRTNLFTLEQKQHLHALTEEVTLRTANAGRWQWISGAIFSLQTLDTTAPVRFYDDGLAWLSSMIGGNMPDLSAMGLGAMDITLYSASPDAPQQPGLMMAGQFSTPTYSAGLYHQSDFAITSRLHLVAGLRLAYEHDRMDYNTGTQVRYDFAMTSSRMPLHLTDLTAAPSYEGVLRRDYLALLPRLALRYDVSHDFNLYASLSRGMRSGGYNVQMCSDLLQGALRSTMVSGVKQATTDYFADLAAKGMPQAVIDMIMGGLDKMPAFTAPDAAEAFPYKPEYSWNYELGLHYRHAAFSLSAAAYYIAITDQQIARFAPSGMGRVMVNAGRSRSFGAELTAAYTARLTAADDLVAHLAYGYTNAKFDDDDNHAFVPYIPAHTLGLDACYQHRFAHGALRSLSFGINGNVVGRTYWTEDNLLSQPLYALLGARLVLDLGRVNITLWGRNLTGTTYDTFRFLSMQREFAQSGKPAQGGIDIRLSF